MLELDEELDELEKELDELDEELDELDEFIELESVNRDYKESLHLSLSYL